MDESTSTHPSMAHAPAPGLPHALASKQGLLGDALRIPLVLKLLGANLILAIAALVLLPRTLGPTEMALTWVVLAVSFAVNALLVRIALLPLDAFEHVARAVSGGDLTARVPVLAVADRQLTRVADAFNGLLARAASDRAQIQHLVRESLRAREVERAGLAQQLRDSTAQQLAALSLQLAAAIQTNRDPNALAPLRAAHDIASGMSDDVRRIADSVYPGLLGRFGLYPALATIARRTRERTSIEVSVDTDHLEPALSLAVTTALYGVAEEAMRNVERHSGAKSARIALTREGREVQLTVEDDGRGFEPSSLDHAFTGIGLFRARELLAHAGGELRVISTPGGGTRVIATAVVDDDGR
jgi:two-component system sensor histidine kinase UhpB